MRFQLLAAAAVLLSASLAAHADTDTNFNFTDVSVQGGGSITGYITIDTTTGMAVGSDFTMDSTDAGDAAFTGGAVAYAKQGSNLYLLEFDSSNVSYTVVSLYIDVGSLVGYTGGDLSTNKNTESNLLNSDFDNAYFTATLTPEAAVTPEPSSLALLATGLLGVAGVVRRRLV